MSFHPSSPRPVPLLSCSDRLLVRSSLSQATPSSPLSASHDGPGKADLLAGWASSSMNDRQTSPSAEEHFAPLPDFLKSC